MSSCFPAMSDLRPHLSDSAVQTIGAAPPSPSSTSVSDGSGPDEFEVDEHALLGPARSAAIWKGKGLAAGDGLRRASHDTDEETASGKEACPAGELLPYEIWVHIFKFLPSTRDLKTCLLVSHLWCQVGVEILWHKPSFYRLTTLHRLLTVIDPPPRSWTPSTDPNPPPARPPATFPYAHFIRRLNLMNITEGIDDRVFHHLRPCARLERLTLQGCSKLTDDALETVLGHGNMPELVALDLTNVRLLTDVTISALAVGCPRLQGLNLTGCGAVTDEGIVKVAENCRLLRRIKLVKCNLVTDVSIIALARSCPLLLEVDLVDVPLITAAGIREVWLYSSNLRELRLSNCGQVDDQGFPYLFPPSTRSSSSTNFNANRSLFPPASLLPASEATTPLSSVCSSPDPSTTELASSTTLIPPPNWMRSFDHLRILDLTSCVLLTDQAVDAIITNAPRIRSLVLAKCFELTDESINSICRLGRSLHQLHMGHVSCITDGAVSRLARTCTRLRYVDFACCPLLSDISVLELSQLSKLRRIGLVRVANLTDHAIHALVERPSSLERIHLSYCVNISIEAIHYLLQRLRNLTHLSLTGVPAFQSRDLQKFCRQPPKDFNAHQREAFCVYSGNGVRELRQYLSSIYDAAQRSEASASSPTSSVSISFDHADQEEAPALELDGDPSLAHQARADQPGFSPAIEGSRMRATPLGFGLFGGRTPAASANTSPGGGAGGFDGGASDGGPVSPVVDDQEHPSRVHHPLAQGPSSPAPPLPPAAAEASGSTSLGSRLIRLGRNYTG